MAPFAVGSSDCLALPVLKRDAPLKKATCTAPKLPTADGKLLPGEIAMTTALAEKSCTPCRDGIPLLTPEEARGYRAQAPDWSLMDGAGGSRGPFGSQVARAQVRAAGHERAADVGRGACHLLAARSPLPQHNALSTARTSAAQRDPIPGPNR